MPRSDEKYRAFVEQSSEGIWCFEPARPIPVGLPEDEQIEAIFATGTLSECNLMMARMYGFESPEEILGARLVELLTPTDPANVEYLRAFIRSGYRLSDAESHEVDRRGVSRTFLNNLTGIVEGGALVRAWGTQRDVTERRVLEERLRASQKLEAMGRLAGGIAHDFNNLLTAIRGYGDLALRALPPAEPTRRRIHQIHAVVDQASALVRQLLAFSRRDPVAPVLLDLAGVVHALEEVLDRLRGDRVTLSFRDEPGLPRVLADRTQMEQVIVNLVVNARDAMPDGGEIVIAVHGDAPCVVLSVRDTGVGMTSDVRDRIFDPFFTTKASSGGTGLGLATVQAIVHGCGGSIVVESAPGAGTTFSLRFPAGVAADLSAATDAAPRARGGAGD